MKFEEVLPAFREGKKIRRKFWSNEAYIRKGKIFVFERVIDEYNDVYVLTINDLWADDWEIVKEPKKVKLKDLTEEQFKKWQNDNCCESVVCANCPFCKVNCNLYSKDIWVKNKEFYSNKFLNQEIELKEE